MVREATEIDLNELLNLYLYLHEKNVPKLTPPVLNVWKKMINDPNHHIILAEEDSQIVSSCICVVIPNLTRNVRPYAFVENVVTDTHYRNNGYATACLNSAVSIAKAENCYKIMLLTGAKEESTLNFYRKAGFNSADKTAFIQWL